MTAGRLPASVLGSCTRIHLEEACGRPQALTEAVVARAGIERSELEVQTGLVVGDSRSDAPFYEAVAAGSIRCVTWMPGGALRGLPTDVVRLDYPGTATAYRRGELEADAAAISVAADGTLGIQAGYTPAVVDAVRSRGGAVVVERNSALPSVAGAPAIDLADATVIDTDRPPAQLRSRTPTEVQRVAAGHATTLVPDGACLEIGLGGICDAVVAALAVRGRRPSFHSGMLSDAVLAFGPTGAAVAETPIGGAPFTCGLLVGSSRLWEWACSDARVRLEPLEITHGVETLASIDRFCAVNSALQVDLRADVNAESVGGRVISGPGGQPAFAAGAAAAPHGRSIVVLTATTPRGASTIVSDLDGPVTTPGRHVDFVVTEHGIAEIGDSRDGNGRALAAVAAPEHRDHLLESLKA